VSATLYPLSDPLALADAIRELEEAAISASHRSNAVNPSGADERKAEWGFLVDRMLEHSYAV